MSAVSEPVSELAEPPPFGSMHTYTRAHRVWCACGTRTEARKRAITPR